MWDFCREAGLNMMIGIFGKGVRGLDRWWQPPLRGVMLGRFTGGCARWGGLHPRLISGWPSGPISERRYRSIFGWLSGPVSSRRYRSIFGRLSGPVSGRRFRSIFGWLSGRIAGFPSRSIIGRLSGLTRGDRFERGRNLINKIRVAAQQRLRGQLA